MLSLLSVFGAFSVGGAFSLGFHLTRLLSGVFLLALHIFVFDEEIHQGGQFRRLVF